MCFSSSKIKSVFIVKLSNDITLRPLVHTVNTDEDKYNLNIYTYKYKNGDIVEKIKRVAQEEHICGFSHS